MTIAERIAPDRVIVDARIAGKTQLLQDLARRSAAALGLNQGVIYDALQAREMLGSTGLGKGFAVPHARLASVTQPFALLLRLARPIDFAAIDDQPVDLVVLLLTPADSAGQHLSTLAAVSRPMRDDAFMQRLRQARDAAALHAVLAGYAG